ncbi:MAG: shikimate dehydrogenase [Candidatus Dojkabacteria bacterium]|nr:shikimate dehydrogenase [Candidatus Dojkabacteria bacterium]
MNITINGNTEIYCIYGHPVKHSKSPIFQTFLFQKYGINAIYIPFEIKPENIKDAINAIRIFNIKGTNITVPHKESVISYLDDLSDEVKTIKAVNTIKNIDGKLYGYNTDWYGFYESIKRNLKENKIKTALVIGAGGSTRAIIFGLIRLNVDHIIITNRTVSKAEEIKNDFINLHKEISVIPLEEINKCLLDVDIIINTTSVGLKDDGVDLFDYDNISSNQIIFDVIYKETKLIKKAQEKGCEYLTGHDMLIYQGIKAFEIWTDIYPNEESIFHIRKLISH